MKSFKTVAVFFILSVGHIAGAEAPSLNGEWVVQQRACSSGEALPDMGQEYGYYKSSTEILRFDGDKVSLNIKASGLGKDEARQRLRADLEKVNKNRNSATNEAERSFYAGAAKALAQLNHLEAGGFCEWTEVRSFKKDGDMVTMGIATSETASAPCISGKTADDKETKWTVDAQGPIVDLRETPATSDDDVCPRGQSVVITLKKK